MERDEFLDAIIGLKLYDTGATDAGIKDDELKDKCSKFMSDNIDLVDKWLNEYVADLLATTDYNYTLEDVHELIEWLGGELDYDY